MQWGLQPIEMGEYFDYLEHLKKLRVGRQGLGQLILSFENIFSPTLMFCLTITVLCPTVTFCY